MKRILILLAIGVVLISISILWFGTITIQPQPIPFKQSEFYKTDYQSTNYLLINVWSVGTKTLLEENPELKTTIESKNIHYITFSTYKDSTKLATKLKNNLVLKTYDKTLKNFASRDAILQKIGLDGINNSDDLIKLNVVKTLYTALIKNKKILKFVYGYDFNTIKTWMDSIN